MERTHDRRTFLARVGSGLLVSTAGLALADEFDVLGLLLADEPDRLEFGDLEGLASRIQETPADELIPWLRDEWKRGTGLESITTATALANARTFAGQDYVGYHGFMALVPALEISRRLPGDRAALPVFKVVHRNARRIQEVPAEEMLRPVSSTSLPDDPRTELLTAGRNGRFDEAEAVFAGVAAGGPRAAFGALQPLVRDNIDVHQVVIAYRSYDMMQLTGERNGLIMLRQVLRHCIDRDNGRRNRGRPAPSIRELLPELVEAHRLARPIEPTKRLDDADLEELAQLVFSSERDDAARAVAARLDAGVSREDVGEALSLAAVRLLLHDPGRSRSSPGRPRGSVHGASVGLHASDSADAWRGIAAANGPADANASLVTAAWHTAGQSAGMDPARPRHAATRDSVQEISSTEILGALAEALRGGDQPLSCALAERYGNLDQDPDALLAVLVEPAILHDGALHHEKYFHTATGEFSRSRPAFRWAHLVALTRVMASGYGIEAEGIELSREVLGV